MIIPRSNRLDDIQDDIQHDRLRIVLVVPGGVARDDPRHVIPSIAWLVERLAARHELSVFSLYGGDGADRQSPYAWRGAIVHDLAARHKGEYGTPGPRLALPGLGLVRSTLAARAIVRRSGGADVVHGIWGSASGLLAALLGRALGAPTVISLYGGELVGLPDIGYGAQRSRRDRMQVATAMKLADRVTAPTDFMRRLAREHGTAVEVIPLGVDVGALAGADATISTVRVGPPWRLLFVGNLNRVKDPFTLIEAVARLCADGRDVRLDVAGADHLGGAVERQAEALGHAAPIRFHGLIDHRALAPLYLGSHLLVIPSRHEAGPVVALEAACLGLPIVGSAVGHVADWAPTAATAVPPGDAAALARAIAALLDDPARRAATAAEARAWAMRHDADWTAAAFERVYRELIAGRRPAG